MLRVLHENRNGTTALQLASAWTRVRLNYDRGTQFQTKWPHHACAARRARIRSRQDDAHTQRGRRTRPCDVHKRARMSTAGGAGGWRAQGDEDGQEMGCYGGRTCSGNGVRGSAMLRGKMRWVARASLGCWAGPRSRADRVAECSDSGDGWSAGPSPLTRSTSVVTAVAFTALCFAYLGRIRPTPLAAAQTCARARRASR